jgi:hypothetical protein
VRALSSFVAVASLFGAVALVPMIGGGLFVLFLFGLFLLALVGIRGGTRRPHVHQHDPAMDPKKWRNGS